MYVDTYSDRVISEIDIARGLADKFLETFVEDRDALLMNIVLKYFSVLAHEKDAYLEQMDKEIDALKIKRKHCYFDREVQVQMNSI